SPKEPAMPPTTTTLRLKRAFRPSVEALEELTVLNATVLFSAGAITITGDNKATSVLIQDQGNYVANGKVTVLVNGQQALQVDAKTVSAIQFDMGQAADTVQYNLTGQLIGELLSPIPGSSRAIIGNLGGGNDTFLANIQNYLGSAQLSFHVKGGPGGDTMTL